MELKFEKCTKDPSVYRKEEGAGLLIIAIYVDDLFVTGTSLSLITRFKEEMSAKFEMSDLGRLTYYLGIEVFQHNEGITLVQKRYALKILEDTEMKDSNLVHTPMEVGLVLGKLEHEEDVDATRYRRSIGCLRYLLHTRPDLSHCVGMLSRFMQNPKVSHGAALKQVIRYLKGTTHLGLCFE
uniref:Retrovirus-related Pol polyprotein from transposon TNT 1-94 n=1 Tax=Noccaea caerulescens TaxID=107243 RepID=A0A1J3FUC1_NOCCA